MSDSKELIKQESAIVAISKKKRTVFLKTLALTGKVMTSANAAGYASTVFLNKLRKKDKEFAALWEDALDAAGDVVEEEAFRRALDGVLEAVYYRGKICGYKTNHSDAMLLTLLKRFKPQYRDKIDVHKTLKHDFGITIIPMTATNALNWEESSAFVHKSQKALNAQQDVIEGEVIKEVAKDETDIPNLKRGS